MQSKPQQIVIYFGTFDPIHENHLHVCSYLANTMKNLKEIFIVPNSDGSSFKPFANPLLERIKIIQKRLDILKEEEVSEGISERGMSSVHDLISIYHPQRIKTNWYGREKICSQIESHRPYSEIMVLLGSDSINSSMQRAGTSTVANFPYRFLILPRMGYDGDVALSSNAVLVKDYHEKVQVSSTAIRKKLVEQTVSVPPEWLHPELTEYINEQGFYNFEHHKGAGLGKIIAIVGPPGSGKSYLGRKISATEHSLFISTGDIYRAHKARRSIEYNILQTARDRGGQSAFKPALNQFIIRQLIHRLKKITDRRSVIIEGLKEGDLTAIGEYIQPVAKVILLENNKETLVKRLINRSEGREEDTPEGAEHRIHNYYAHYQEPLIREIEALGLPLEKRAS